MCGCWGGNDASRKASDETRSGQRRGIVWPRQMRGWDACMACMPTFLVPARVMHGCVAEERSSSTFS